MSLKSKTQTAEEGFESAIVIDAFSEAPKSTPAVARICWNTGEQKNCPSCYLSKGCKAK